MKPAEIPAGTNYIGLEHIERGGRIIGAEIIGSFKVSSAKFRFTSDHILFAKLRPNLGKIARPRTNGVCSTDILPMLPRPHVDKAYLAHFLSQPKMVKYAASRTTGINLPRLSPSELARFEIPLPPIQEQRRIAAILDCAASLVKRSGEAHHQLKLLPDTLFHNMFSRGTWPSRPLSQLAEVTSGITKGRKVRSDIELHEVPYLAVSNVKDRYLQLDTVKTIGVTPSERTRFRLQHGDLLLTEGGDPDKLGRGTLWRDELPEAIYQNHIFRVRVKEFDLIDPDYLSWFTASRPARTYFLRAAKQTTGIASINKSQLGALPVAIPPRELQAHFVSRLSTLNSRERSIVNRRRRLEELFASLQARAFSGRL